jgi:EAL and modified HD-GYP domain-containing signal transduction protein
MDFFVARQPILDRDQQLFAYELLFRNGRNNSFPAVDGDQASCNVLANSFLNLGIETITGGRLAFINFTHALLVHQIPTLFPPKNIVVEILEDVVPGPEVIEACRALVDKGFILALDDFLYHRSLEALLSLAAIVKIDFRATPPEQIGGMVEGLASRGLKLLAEKVETQAEFQQAAAMGFDYFQGYFFSRPQILQGRDLTPSRLQLLQILGEINRSDCSIERLETLIKSDVSIPYKLLRYMNSSYFKRAREITSIKHAIAMLGLKESRKFISLIATGALAADKPSELIRTSIVRARFCETLGMTFIPRVEAAELFLTGLFSLIDAILDRPMAEIIASLPLADSVREALVAGNGPGADLLQAVCRYEAGQWGACLDVCERNGVEAGQLPEHYRQALSWAEAFPLE